MVNYTWMITKLDIRPSIDNLTNVVSGAHWTLTGTKLHNGTNYGANMSGITSFGEPDPNNFIDYNQITFQDVVNWLTSFMGQEQVSRLQNDLEASIDNTIQQIENPEFINLPLPWENN